MVDPKLYERRKRYDQSTKGKARRKRAAAKMKAANQRYRQTPKGRAMMRRVNERRVKVGNTSFFMPSKAVAEQARAMRERRRNEFKSRQFAGAEVESAPAGTVPIGANL